MADSKEDVRDEFRRCLKQIDKLLIDGDFKGAKGELARAKKLDPRNPFIQAFQERISVFERKISGGSAQTPTAPEQTDAGEGPVEPGNVPDIVDEEEDRKIRDQLEEEYKRKFTDELRKAEEQAKKLLVEEMRFLKGKRPSSRSSR